MTAEEKAWIDAASYEALLAWWRFAPVGDPIFVGNTGTYFKAALFRKRDEDPEQAVRASKVMERVFDAQQIAGRALAEVTTLDTVGRTCYVNMILKVLKPDGVGCEDLEWDHGIVRAIGDIVEQIAQEAYTAGIADRRRTKTRNPAPFPPIDR